MGELVDPRPDPCFPQTHNLSHEGFAFHKFLLRSLEADYSHVVSRGLLPSRSPSMQADSQWVPVTAWTVLDCQY